MKWLIKWAMHVRSGMRGRLHQLRALYLIGILLREPTYIYRITTLVSHAGLVCWLDESTWERLFLFSTGFSDGNCWMLKHAGCFNKCFQKECCTVQYIRDKLGLVQYFWKKYSKLTKLLCWSWYRQISMLKGRRTLNYYETSFHW